MAEKRVSVRFSAQGGRRVVQEMEGIGRAGSQAMRRIDTSAAVTNARLQTVSRTARSGSMNFRNVGMQLSQVAQQGAVTGNYMQALAFQLPDLTMGFGTLGVAIGAAGAVLAPLIADWIQGGEAARSLQDDVDALSEAMSRLSDAREGAGRSMSDLAEDFAGNARRARELFEIERQLAEMRAQAALTTVAGGLTRDFGFSARDLVDAGAIREGEAAINGLIDRILELEAQSQSLANTAAQQAALDRQIGDLLDRAAALEEVNEDVAELGRRLGIPAEEARELAAMFAELGQATGPQQQFEILSQLATTIAGATDNLAQADDETRQLYDNLLEAARAALELEAAGTGIDDGIAAAAVSASRLAEELGISLGIATRLASMEVVPAQGTAGLNALDENDPRRSAYETRIFDGPTRTVSSWSPPRIDSSSGSGSGSGARQMRETSAAAQMVDRVLRQAEAAAVGFEDAMAVLDRRLDTGQIDMEQYATAVDLLQDKFDQVDTNPLERGLDGVADALARTLVYGEDLGEGLRRVFQQIAVDLLRSGIRELLGSIFSPVGGGGGFNPFAALVAHEGGVVGRDSLPARAVPPAVFAGAPRMHSGGWPGLAPDEVPIIAQRGERVLSREEVRGGAAGGSVVRMKTEVHNYAGADVQTERSTSPEGEQIERIVIRSMNRAVADGRLDRAMGARYGTRPQRIRQ